MTHNFEPDVTLPSSTPPVLAGLIRYLLGVASGYVISQGWFTAEQTTQIVGAVGAIGVGAWSVYSNWKKTQKLKDAIKAPAGLAKP